MGLVYLAVLTLCCWGACWPMLRDPYLAVAAPPELAFPDVPVATFDSRGLT